MPLALFLVPQASVKKQVPLDNLQGKKVSCLGTLSSLGHGSWKLNECMGTWAFRTPQAWDEMPLLHVTAVWP